MYVPQVLKLQWLNNYVNTFLLKRNHNSKLISSFTIWPVFCTPYDCCAPPYPYNAALLSAYTKLLFFSTFLGQKYKKAEFSL